MRLILSLLLLLCLPLSSAAQTFVQFKVMVSTAPWGADGIAEVSPDAPLTVNNTVCIGGFINNNRTLSSVVDDGLNTYTQIVSSATAATSGWIWCAKVETAATEIVATMSTSGSLGRYFMSEFSGTNTSDWIGGSSIAQALAQTTHSTGTVVVQAPASLIWGFTGGDVGGVGEYVADATFTSLNVNGTQGIAGYKSVSVDTAMVNTSTTTNDAVSAAVELLPEIIAIPVYRVRCVPLVSPTCDQS